VHHRILTRLGYSYVIENIQTKHATAQNNKSRPSADSMPMPMATTMHYNTCCICSATCVPKFNSWCVSFSISRPAHITSIISTYLPREMNTRAFHSSSLFAIPPDNARFSGKLFAAPSSSEGCDMPADQAVCCNLMNCAAPDESFAMKAPASCAF